MTGFVFLSRILCLWKHEHLLQIHHQADRGPSSLPGERFLFIHSCFSSKTLFSKHFLSDYYFFVLNLFYFILLKSTGTVGSEFRKTLRIRSVSAFYFFFNYLGSCLASPLLFYSVEGGGGSRNAVRLRTEEARCLGFLAVSPEASAPVSSLQTHASLVLQK